MRLTRLGLVPLLILVMAAASCADSTPSVGSPTSTGASDTSLGATTTATTVVTTTSARANSQGSGGGPGAVGDSSMMERHRATIPAPYAGMTNPITADEASLARGVEAYATCAVCHGDAGLGDGPAGANLDPAPVNIAHTSQMMSDAYLFWRVSEGGIAFDTLMPAWGEALDDETIWDLVNYMRALGEGSVTPGRGAGAGRGNPAAQAVQQAALLATAVDQGLISQSESDVFADAHEIVDARMAELRGTTNQPVDELLTEVLAELVSGGELTQNQADTFVAVHDRLSQAGLLP